VDQGLQRRMVQWLLKQSLGKYVEGSARGLIKSTNPKFTLRGEEKDEKPQSR
jgi:hypothetical protein